MEFSLLKSIGRCDAMGGQLYVRRYLYPPSATADTTLSELLRTPLHEGESVDSWLNRHTDVGNAIQWEHSGFLNLGPAATSYFGWPDEDKQQLHDLVYHFADCNDSNLPDPPENQVDLDDFDIVKQEFRSDHAKNWFLAHVAHTLAVEMGRWVPWSITSYDFPVLANLLDSRSYFSWRNYGNHEVLALFHGRVTPSDPRYTFEFMYKTNLIGYCRLETICRVLNWCRWNLSHFSCPDSVIRNPIDGSTMARIPTCGRAICFDNHWQYRGFSPVRRMTEFTRHRTTNERRHYTAGCHGTVGFLRAVLRSVNIPVDYVYRCGHALAHFMHVDRYLTHGDDPYNRQAKRNDLPIEDILVDKDTFEDWFGSDRTYCDDTIEENIGRGVREAVSGLPPLDPDD